MRPCRLIIDDVRNDSQPARMTLVNKVLVHGACSVRLVEGKIGTGIISPAVIAVKLLEWHQLHRIDSQGCQIVQFAKSAGDVTGLREVAEMQFINHEVVRVRYSISWISPRIAVTGDLECGNKPARAFRIFRKTGIC